MFSSDCDVEIVAILSTRSQQVIFKNTGYHIKILDVILPNFKSSNS